MYIGSRYVSHTVNSNGCRDVEMVNIVLDNRLDVVHSMYYLYVCTYNYVL